MEGDEAKVLMTLTAPNCPAADMILADVEYMTKKVEGVETCKVEITFEPAWEPPTVSVKLSRSADMLLMEPLTRHSNMAAT